jgi:polyisoprenoid-binding protein YceI
MKNYIALIFIAFASLPWAQDPKVLTTDKGIVSFYSQAPLEDIKATNTKTKVVMNHNTGDLLVSLDISEFEFRKALMKRHFNENYMESHLYPKAQFSGKILNYPTNGYTQGLHQVEVQGSLTIHGVTRNVATKASLLKKGNQLTGNTTFPVNVADYKIDIPKLLIRNIAETVEVTIKFTLTE